MSVISLLLVAVHTGITHQLGRAIDQIFIQLGLLPENTIKKIMMSTGPSYSYVSANKAMFILLNLILGVSSFKLISERGAKFSGWIYGISVTIIFLLIGLTLAIQSGDRFNLVCVIWGVAVTLCIQIPLATVVFTKHKVNLRP